VSVVAVVLIVEDDEQVRVLAESILRDEGHTVITATGVDGSEALLDSEQPVDVLFIDVRLGSDLEGGLRVAHNARERRPGLSILYTTGTGLTDGMKALFTEPFRFLPKPYTSEQLIESVAFLIMRANPPPRPQLSL
jgi:DNA-binding NtrC family response regulator